MEDADADSIAQFATLPFLQAFSRLDPADHLSMTNEAFACWVRGTTFLSEDVCQAISGTSVTKFLLHSDAEGKHWSHTKFRDYAAAIHIISIMSLLGQKNDEPYIPEDIVAANRLLACLGPALLTDDLMLVLRPAMTRMPMDAVPSRLQSIYALLLDETVADHQLKVATQWNIPPSKVRANAISNLFRIAGVLNGTGFFPAEQVCPGRYQEAYHAVAIHGTRLSRYARLAEATAWTWSDIDLSRADFSHGTPTTVSLSNTSLHGCDFSGAQIREASLYQVDLQSLHGDRRRFHRRKPPGSPPSR